MGASKLVQYSDNTIDLGIIIRGISHPARIKIVKLLLEFTMLRNIDLCSELELGKSAINAHLLKMKEAGIIHIEFYPNCNVVRLNRKRMIPVLNFIESVVSC